MYRKNDYILSLYKEISPLDKNGRVFMVLNTQENKIYVKKITNIDSGTIYLNVRSLAYPAFPKMKEILFENDCCIIIEEYIPGQTLGEYIAEHGAMNKDIAVNYMLKILRAVDMLHRNGIIHRDLTENNIMLENNGNIKIIDFNISHRDDRTRTKDTVIMGTEGYAAPEQFGFFRSDVRTDIYSLGVLFNFMLTGTTDTAIPKGDKKISDIIKKCTAFDPKDRYINCENVIKTINSQKPQYKNPFILKLIMKLTIAFDLLFGFVYLFGFPEETLFERCNNVLMLLVISYVPVYILGNYNGWQRRGVMACFSPLCAKALSVLLYLFIIILYVWPQINFMG